MMLKAGPGAPLLDVARKASQKQARRNHRSTGLRFCMFRLPAEDAAFLLRLLPLKIRPVGNQKIGVGGDALHPAVFRVSHAATSRQADSRVDSSILRTTIRPAAR